MATSATPPTIPPAMAPAFGFDFNEFPPVWVAALDVVVEAWTEVVEDGALVVLSTDVVGDVSGDGEKRM